MTNSPHALIWIDLEMTGLDVENDVIIELATIVTDSELNILGEGPALAIKQPESKLKTMDEWNVNQHSRSGLLQDVRSSVISLEQAEQETILFLRDYLPSGISPMCGNSVCLDRRFLHRYMPKLEKYFHYRHIDVSTLKELARRWHPAIFKEVKKISTHRAIVDIKESIDELSYYREFFIKKS